MAGQQNETLTKNIFGRLSLGVITVFGVPLGLYVGQSTLETRYDVRDATLEIRHLQDAVVTLRAEQDKIEAQIRALELKVVVMAPRSNDGNDGVDK
jgi:hypothetical protein